MEIKLTRVLIVLLILFIIYMVIQKTGVCSIVRNEREEFNVGAGRFISNRTKAEMGLSLGLGAAVKLAHTRGNYYKGIAERERNNWAQCLGENFNEPPIQDFESWIKNPKPV